MRAERGIRVRIDFHRPPTNIQAVDVFVAHERNRIVVAASRPRRRGVNERTEIEQVQPDQYLDLQRVSALLNQLQAAENLQTLELVHSSNLSLPVLRRHLRGTANRLMDSTKEGLERLADAHASHPIGQALQEELVKPRKPYKGHESHSAQRRAEVERTAAREERDRRRSLVQELKGLAALAGLSQTKLAELLEMDQPNVSRLLIGKILPRKNTVERIERLNAIIRVEQEAKNSQQ